MGQAVSIRGFRMRRALRIGRLFALIQSVVILLLLVWMSEEYYHNQYFQAWTGARLGGFSFFLNGTLAAFYAGLVIAYYLSVPREKVRLLVEREVDVLAEAQANV